MTGSARSEDSMGRLQETLEEEAAMIVLHAPGSSASRKRD